MQLHTFALDNLNTSGGAFSGFLKLRYQHFVENLSWDVPNNGRAEMDQYDNLSAQYVVVMSGDQVVAGARTMPTDAEWLGWTYMIGDASKGLLVGIPSSSMPQDVNDPAIWECTRLVVSESLNAEDRQQALALVVKGLCEVSASYGASALVSLSPLLFHRVLRRLGYDPSPIGDVFEGSEDGRRYRVFKMPIPDWHHKSVPTSSIVTQVA